jgi:hypothetical protein
MCRKRKDDEDFCIQIRRVKFAEADLLKPLRAPSSYITDIEHHLPAFGLVVAAVKVLTHWRLPLDTRHFPSLCQMIEYFCVLKDIQNVNYL